MAGLDDVVDKAFKKPSNSSSVGGDEFCRFGVEFMGVDSRELNELHEGDDERLPDGVGVTRLTL